MKPAVTHGFGAGTLGIVALLAACASAGHPVTPPPGVNLSGVWAIDEAHSQDPSLLMPANGGRGEMGPGPGPGIEEPGEGFGRPEFGEGGRTRFAGRRRGGNPMSARRALNDALWPGDPMTLEQRDTTLAMAFEGGDSVRVPITDHQVTIQWHRGTRVQVKAWWKEGALRLERKLPGGIKVEQTYSRSPGADRLVVDTQVKGLPDGKLQFRRVYLLQTTPSS